MSTARGAHLAGHRTGPCSGPCDQPAYVRASPSFVDNTLWPEYRQICGSSAGGAGATLQDSPYQKYVARILGGPIAPSTTSTATTTCRFTSRARFGADSLSF